MISFRLFNRVALIASVFCLGLTTALPARGQPALSAHEIWQYGRGTIYNFDWLGDKALLGTSNNLIIVDPTSNQAPVSVASAAGSIQQVIASPDGTRFATWDNDNQLRIRDAKTDQVLISLPAGDWRKIAWQPGGKFIAVETGDARAPVASQDKIVLWDSYTGKSVKTIGAYADAVRTMTWHPDGNLLTIVFDNGKIVTQNVIDTAQVYELNADFATGAAWSPDGTMLAETNNDGLPIKIWQWNGSTLTLLKMPNPPLFGNNLSWNADSQHLAGQLIDGSLQIWDTVSGKIKFSAPVPADDFDFFGRQLLWHGKFLAILDGSYRLRIWDTVGDVLVWDSEANQFHNILTGFNVNQRTNLIALVYPAKLSIDVLDGTTGQLSQTLRVTGGFDFRDITWSPSGDMLAVAGGKSLYIWRFDRQLNPSLQSIEFNNDLILKVSASPDGILAVDPDSLLTGVAADPLEFIDSKTGQFLPGSPQPSLEILNLNWSPDGKHLAIYKSNLLSDNVTVPDVQLDLLDIATNQITTVHLRDSQGKETDRFNDHYSWLPDSSGIIGVAVSGAVWHWHIDTGKSEIIVPGPSDYLTVAYAPFNLPLSINVDGNWFAMGDLTADGQMNIFSVTTGQRMLTLNGFAFTPNYFAWGWGNMLFVYDGIIHAYQIS